MRSLHRYLVAMIATMSASGALATPVYYNADISASLTLTPNDWWEVYESESGLISNDLINNGPGTSSSPCSQFGPSTCNYSGTEDLLTEDEWDLLFGMDLSAHANGYADNGVSVSSAWRLLRGW